MNKRINVRDVFNCMREYGVFFVICAICTNYVIRIPIKSASQGVVSFGFTEIFVLFGALYLFFLLLSQKYVLKGISKKIFILLFCSCAISVGVCLWHVVVQGKSIIEYVGVLRNLYTCALIYFLADAKKINVNGIINGLAILVTIMTAIMFYNALVINVGYKVEPISYADYSYISVAGFALITLLAYKNRTRFTMLLLYINGILIIPGTLLTGSRAAWLLVVMVISTLLFCLIIKRIGKKVFHFIIALLLGAVLTVGVTVSLNTVGMQASIFRASAGIRNLVVSISGENLSQVTDEKIMQTADLPQKINSSKDVLNVAIASKGSGARSNSIRGEAWTAFGEKIRQNPIAGFGERFVQIENAYGNKISINAHNFVLEIAALMGGLGVIAYIGLMLFIYAYIVFKVKTNWFDKIAVLVFSGVIFLFAFVQPAITGGIACNIVIWSVVTWCIIANRTESEEGKS